MQRATVYLDLHLELVVNCDLVFVDGCATVEEVGISELELIDEALRFRIEHDATLDVTSTSPSVNLQQVSFVFNRHRINARARDVSSKDNMSDVDADTGKVVAVQTKEGVLSHSLKVVMKSVQRDVMSARVRRSLAGARSCKRCCEALDAVRYTAVTSGPTIDAKFAVSGFVEALVVTGARSISDVTRSMTVTGIAGSSRTLFRTVSAPVSVVAFARGNIVRLNIRCDVIAAHNRVVDSCFLNAKTGRNVVDAPLNFVGIRQPTETKKKKYFNSLRRKLTSLNRKNIFEGNYSIVMTWLYDPARKSV